MFQATFSGHRNRRLELPLTSLQAGRDHFGEKNKLRTLATLKLKINALIFFYCENPFLWDFYLNPFLDLRGLGEL